MQITGMSAARAWQTENRVSKKSGKVLATHLGSSMRTGKRADGSAVAGWKEFWAHPAAWSPFVLVAADGI